MQFKQQLPIRRSGRSVHDEQTVAGDEPPECCQFRHAAAAETAEGTAGASTTKAAVRLAGTDAESADAGRNRPADAIAPERIVA